MLFLLVLDYLGGPLSSLIEGRLVSAIHSCYVANIAVDIQSAEVVVVKVDVITVEKCNYRTSIIAGSCSIVTYVLLF